MDKLGDRIEETRTTFRTRITTIQVRREGMESVNIFPRDVGMDTEGWAIGEAKIPVNSLEEAIIVAMEMQVRQ